MCWDALHHQQPRQHGSIKLLKELSPWMLIEALSLPPLFLYYGLSYSFLIDSWAPISVYILEYGEIM